MTYSKAKALPQQRLRLRFSDGSQGTYDLAGFIAQGGEMVEPLKSPEYFARVFVEMSVPTWPNGFDPINLSMELRDAGALSRTAPAA